MKVTPEMRIAARYACDAALEGGSIEDCALAAVEAAVRELPEPTDTVLELNKRITALHQRLERIRICVIEWEHGNQASAVMPRIRHELDQENP